MPKRPPAIYISAMLLLIVLGIQIKPMMDVISAYNQQGIAPPIHLRLIVIVGLFGSIYLAVLVYRVRKIPLMIAGVLLIASGFWALWRFFPVLAADFSATKLAVYLFWGLPGLLGGGALFLPSVRRAIPEFDAHYKRKAETKQLHRL